MVPPVLEDLLASLCDASRVSSVYSPDNSNHPDVDSDQAVSHVFAGTPFYCYPEEPILFSLLNYPTPSPSLIHFLESCLHPPPLMVSIVDLGPSRVCSSVPFGHSSLLFHPPHPPTVFVTPSLGFFEGGPIPQLDSPINVARDSTSSDAPSTKTINAEPGAHKRGVKNSKCIKVKNKGSQLILGEGILMVKVINTANIVLVRWVHGKNYSASRLQKWISNIWGQILELLPLVVMMLKG